MRFRSLLAVAFGAALTTACMTMSDPANAPDRFGYMEEVEGAQALAWVRAQNARSLAVLENDPRFAPLQAEALAIANSRDRLALGSVDQGYLYNFWQDETHVRGIWRRSPLSAYQAGRPVWETILDIDALATAESANHVFKGTACLPDMSRCMISLSNGGLDATTWREFDLPTRQFVAGGFVVPEAKSGLSWIDRDTLLIGTDWGAGTLTESGYPMIVKRWQRGTPLSAAAEIMRGQPSDVGVWAGSTIDETGRVETLITEADTFFTAKNFRLTATGVEQLPLPERATIQGLHKGQLVFTLEQAWRPRADGPELPTGALVSMPLDRANDAGGPPVTLIYGPGPRESIEGVAITRDSVLVAGYANVRGRLLRFSFDGRGWLENQIDLPSNGAIGLAGSDPRESTAFVVYEDFLQPDTLYHLDARTSRTARVQSLPAQFNAEGFVTEQFEARSRDGTMVPYFVVRPRNQTANGDNPTLLYGYGGFQVSMTPGYGPTNGKLWLERGGTYVLANIRGGGEFGPSWHQAGLKTNRQVIYDDFIAVAEDLIARGITSPRRLGIMGGSNGGLLMGVMLTQRPELFRAAVVQVPLLDMLNFANENMLAGASWVAEYGDPRLGPDGQPTHPEERAFLAQLSPYQNLNPRAVTPVEPFFVTSTKDDRVHPAHARKTAARLEAAGVPFYYYENIDGGHSAAANLQEAARRRALEYVYLMRRLMD